VRDLSTASLSYSDLTTGWDDRRERFVALTDEVWRVRAYGDFWSYCLVAEGAVDIAAEPEVKLWDIAPLDILIRRPAGNSPASTATRAASRQCAGHQRVAARRGRASPDVKYLTNARTLLQSKIPCPP
jgi:fructose-1,6-bisphosphatase/inositol monophosphatase family enzyme